MKNVTNYLSRLQKNINHWQHLYAIGQVDRETAEYVIKGLTVKFWSDEMARIIQKDADTNWEKKFWNWKETRGGDNV